MHIFPMNNNNWLSQYRGALWGLLVGGAIGSAAMVNIMAMVAPVFIVPLMLAFWAAGGLFGHAMQVLMNS